MSAADRLRASVEQAGGRREMTLRELRDAFGTGRLTAARRTAIVGDLLRAGLRPEPDLARLRLDDRVVLIDARSRPGPAPARPDPAAATAARGPLGPPARSTRTRRRRGVAAAVVTGAVVLLVLVAALGSRGADHPSAPAATGATTAGSAAAEAAQGQSRADALGLIRRAQDALEGDDTRTARRLVAGVAVEYAVEPAIGRRIARIRDVARATDRYLRARDDAGAGSYLAARRTMMSLGAFRDAPRLAGEYGRSAASVLVHRARAATRSTPARALEILDQAEALAPALASIEPARQAASKRLAVLTAPPAPAPEPVSAPAPARSSGSRCSPDYTGACIPDVPYDIDCGDVPDEDFRSVGSDPYGFDGDGDGVACESS